MDKDFGSRDSEWSFVEVEISEEAGVGSALWSYCYFEGADRAGIAGPPNGIRPSSAERCGGRPTLERREVR